MNEREELRVNLAQLIKQSAGDNDEAEKLLNKHIDEIEMDDALQKSELVEQIKAQLNSQGDITVATSQKVQNLKFKLADFLLEAGGSGLSVAGSLLNPLVLAFTGIKFLWELQKLMTLTIEQKDAEVLLALYGLVKQSKVLTTDEVHELVGKRCGEDQVARSLDTLEELGCITVTMNEIHLNETIVVQKQS